MERMNALAREGLIADSFLGEWGESTSAMLENDLAFMEFDYSQTQTLYNETALNTYAGESFRAVMIPVARWNDGSGEAFFRFSEDWRSASTNGIAITVAGIGSDTNKLYAALAMIDYLYTKEGRVLMSYGPDEFIKTTADRNYVMFDLNGEPWPEIADSTRAELWALAAGNYTNYYRYFIGSTIVGAKAQALEVQCTVDAGRLGMSYISNAIGLGVIKHPELDFTDNPWYTSVLSDHPLDGAQENLVNSNTELNDQFSIAMGYHNLLVDMIVNGYANVPANTARDMVDFVANGLNGSVYLAIIREAWEYAAESFIG